MIHIRLLFITGLFSFLLGCGSTDIRYPDPPPSDHVGAYSMNVGTVKVASKVYVEDRGTITVPENRSKPDSRFIHLPFRRLRSGATQPKEPVYLLSGGPGASNLDWSLESLQYLLPEHDLVCVGYRGVDGSVILDCPEVADAMNGNGELLSEESMKAIGRAWSAAGRRLTASGIDLDGYTMPEVIEDQEAVRKVLGYKRIDLLSGSYGTRVAYLYGCAHHEQIQRSAMIGANSPGRFVWDPQVIDMQLRYYSKLWSRDSVMSLRSNDLYGDMRSVLDNMPRKWLFLSIDPGKVKVVTFALLFHRNTAAKVFDAYLAAKEGDPSGLAMLSAAYNYVIPSLFTWGDLASKAVSADFDSTRDYYREMEPQDFPFGAPMSKLLWGPMKYGRWPVHLIPEKYRALRTSDVETLLLSGSIDLSTPAEVATNELLPHLKNGKQIILSEYGHVDDVLWLNRENTIRILTSYYDTGVPDTTLNKYIPMDFNVSMGFPAMAKWGFITAAVLGAGLGAIIVWAF